MGCLKLYFKKSIKKIFFIIIWVGRFRPEVSGIGRLSFFSGEQTLKCLCCQYKPLETIPDRKSFRRKLLAKSFQFVSTNERSF